MHYPCNCPIHELIRPEFGRSRRVEGDSVEVLELGRSAPLAGAAAVRWPPGSGGAPNPAQWEPPARGQLITQESQTTFLLILEKT